MEKINLNIFVSITNFLFRIWAEIDIKGLQKYWNFIISKNLIFFMGLTDKKVILEIVNLNKYYLYMSYRNIYLSIALYLKVMIQFMLKKKMLFQDFDYILSKYQNKPLIIALFHFPLLFCIIYIIALIAKIHNRNVVVVKDRTGRYYLRPSNLIILENNAIETSANLLKYIKNNDLIIFFADAKPSRQENQKEHIVETIFLKHTLKLPLGILLFAYKYNIPIILLEHYIDKHALIFKVSDTMERNDLNLNNYIQQTSQHISSNLEKLVSQYPEQWLLLGRLSDYMKESLGVQFQENVKVSTIFGVLDEILLPYKKISKS